jgi:hypothetical protein
MLNENNLTNGNDSDIELNANPSKIPTPFYIYYGKNKNGKIIYGNHHNVEYPYRAVVNNEKDLSNVSQGDHTTILFTDGYLKDDKEKINLKHCYRSNETFIKSKCLYADVDNDFTENEENWITPKKFLDIFKDYECYLVSSRNHNKIKIDDKGVEHKPRPKFHIYFPLKEEITDGKRFIECQKKLIDNYSFFDKSLCDCGRFLYGNFTNKENNFVIFNSGKCIIELLETLKTKAQKNNKTQTENIEDKVKREGKIKNGERHETLLKLAYSYYSKNGITENEEEDIQKCREYLLKMNESIFENPLDANDLESSEGKELYNICVHRRNKYAEYKEKNQFIFNNENEASDFMEKEGLILFLENRNFYIMNTKITNVENVYNLKTFFHRYKKYKIKIGIKTDDKGKENDLFIPFTDWFLEKETDDKYTTLYNIKYNPALPIGKNKEKRIFNTYKGFAYKPKNHNIDISPIYDFILDIINSGNIESNDYILNWSASLFQFPARKITAVGLKGLHGLGKNVFFNFLGEILGNDNYFYADKAEYLDSSFNAIFQEKLLCFFDEGVWSNDRKSIGFIKAAITNNDSVINEKHEKMRTNKTYYKIVMATNENWIVKVEHGNRRFFIPTLNNKWSYDYVEGNKEKQKERDGYFNMLSKYFYFSNKQGKPYTAEELSFLDKVKEQFLYDMMNRDITNWKWENIPITEELIYQQDLSEDPITKTIKDFIKGDLDIHYYKKETQQDKIYVLLDDIHTAVKEETGLKTVSKTKIGHKMKELLPEVQKSKYDYYGTMKSCYVFDKDFSTYISHFSFPGIVLIDKQNIEMDRDKDKEYYPLSLSLSLSIRDNMSLTKNEVGNGKWEIGKSTIAVKQAQPAYKEEQNMNKNIMEQRTYTMPYYDDTPISDNHNKGGETPASNKQEELLSNEECDKILETLWGKAQ